MKPIQGYPDYAVCEDGHVWRITPHTFYRSAKKNIPLPYRLKTPVAAQTGYLSVRLKNEDGWRTFNVHRLVCEAFHGPANGREVCHNDGNRTNCRKDNLRWGTEIENMADCLRHGTRNQGERVWISKLSDFAVRVMRKIPYRRGLFTQLAETFGISVESARDAYRGNTFKHLGDVS